MSFDATLWAWKQTPKTMAARVVLQYLADKANKKNEAFPAVNTIARACCCSTNTVRKALRCLVGSGLIQVKEPGGGHLTTRYELLLTPSESEPLQNMRGSESEVQDFSHCTPEVQILKGRGSNSEEEPVINQSITNQSTVKKNVGIPPPPSLEPSPTPARLAEHKAATAAWLEQAIRN